MKRQLAVFLFLLDRDGFCDAFFLQAIGQQKTVRALSRRVESQ